MKYDELKKIIKENSNIAKKIYIPSQINATHNKKCNLKYAT